MSPTTLRRAAAAACAAAAVLAAGATAASAAPITVAEGDTAVDVPIDLSFPSLVPRTVSYETVDGTAKAGEDYVAVPSTPTMFAPLQIHKSVAITIKADALHEGDESFVVRLGTGVDQLVTIVDDDPAPVPAPTPTPAPTPDAAPTPEPAAQDTRSQEQPPPQGHVCCAVSIALPSRIRYAGLTKSGSARLKVTCSARISCDGTVDLTWHGLKLGSAWYQVRGHSTRIVKVRLSARGRRALARHHSLRVRARLDDGSSRRLTITR